MLDVEEGADIFARIWFIQKNSAPSQEIPVAFKDNVCCCIKEGVTGADKGSQRFSRNHQFFDEEACHDGFACSRIIGQEVAERLPGDHLFVDCGNLVRQGIDQRGMDCEQGIKEISHPYSVRFRNQSKHTCIGIEAPGLPWFDDFNGGLSIAEQEFVSRTTGRVLVGELHNRVAVPFDVDDSHRPIRPDSFDQRSFFKILKMGHGPLSQARKPKLGLKIGMLRREIDGLL